MSIKIHNLTVSYNFHPAVHHLNATINQGQWLAIVGPTGHQDCVNIEKSFITHFMVTIWSPRLSPHQR